MNGREWTKVHSLYLCKEDGYFSINLSRIVWSSKTKCTEYVVNTFSTAN